MKLASFTILLLTTLYDCGCHPTSSVLEPMKVNELAVNQDGVYSSKQVEKTLKTELDEKQKLQFEELLKIPSNHLEPVEPHRKQLARYNSTISAAAYVDRNNLLHISVKNGERTQIQINDKNCNCSGCITNEQVDDDIYLFVRCQQIGIYYMNIPYYRDLSDPAAQYQMIPIKYEYYTDERNLRI